MFRFVAVAGAAKMGRPGAAKKRAAPHYYFFFFFFVAVRPFCAPWACLYIISGAGVVSGTPHPAV